MVVTGPWKNQVPIQSQYDITDWVIWYTEAETGLETSGNLGIQIYGKTSNFQGKGIPLCRQYALTVVGYQTSLHQSDWRCSLSIRDFQSNDYIGGIRPPRRAKLLSINVEGLWQD